MYTENLAIPVVVCCPFCHSGSSEMLDEIQQAGIWGEVNCHSCKNKFEIATAIDEMFINTTMSGYTLWTGGKQICRPISIASGNTKIIDIKGIFEEVYVISPFFENFSCLAGGFATKYIPQGYAMVALAPNPEGNVHILTGFMLIEGRKAQQQHMNTWKKMLLNAKLSIYESPNLTIVMALNAVDLYLEELTNKSISPGRPGSWNNLIKEHFGVKLSKILDSNFQNIEKFVQVRNEIAHGREYINKLPENLIPLEKEWIHNGKYIEGTGAYAPSAKFALESALDLIRSCRRIDDKGKYLPVFNCAETE